MRYYYPTANLNTDIDNHEADMEDWLNSQPKCCRCKEPIQEEMAYTFYNNFYEDYLICEQCIEENDINLQKVWII